VIQPAARVARRAVSYSPLCHQSVNQHLPQPWAADRQPSNNQLS